MEVAVEIPLQFQDEIVTDCREEGFEAGGTVADARSAWVGRPTPPQVGYTIIASSMGEIYESLPGKQV